jgi:hypothetical protein
MLGLLKKVLPKAIKIGFGKVEALKATKGLAVGGVGAAAVTVLNSYGYIPEQFLAPEVLPYTVAVVAAIVNFLRQVIRDNT